MDPVTLGMAKAAAARAAQALYPQRSRYDVWFVGDSLTAGGNFDSASTSKAGVSCFDQSSYPAHTFLRANGRWRYGGVAATAGHTPQQILADHVPTVLAAKPWSAVVLCGTNWQAGASTATHLAAIGAVYDALRLAGITVFPCTVPPYGSNPVGDASTLVTSKVNAFIRRYAQIHGLRCIDFYSALVDQSTGAYRAGTNSGDNIHPNAIGKQIMGQTAAPIITAAAPPANALELSVLQTDAANLFAGPLFPSLAGSNGAPNFWSGQSLGTSSYTLAGLTGVVGNVCTITRADTDINVGHSSTTTLVPGNRYSIAMYFGAALQPSAFAANACQWTFRLEAADFKYLLQFSNWGLDVPAGWHWFEFVCPSGLSSYVVRPRLLMAGAPTAATTPQLKIAQFTMRDLSALAS